MTKVLKWLGVALGGLIVLVLVAGAVIYVRSESVLDRRWDVPERVVALEPDSATVARAAHLADALYGCTTCHGEDLAGGVMLDGPPGRFVASNLTAAGVGGRYTMADWDRAIRHGVRPDGRALIIMGADRFHHIPDEDFAGLVAFIRAHPPVERDLPEETVRPLGRFLLGTGLYRPAAFRIDHAAPPPPRTAPDTTAAYGAYLVALSCVECHGERLQGGKHPDPAGPAVPPLGAAALWSFDEFARTLRTGTAPGGRALDPEWMPWEVYRRLSDDELRAVHAHIRAVTGRERPIAQR